MNTIDFSVLNTIHDYQHLNIDFDEHEEMLWVYLDAMPRPCVTPKLVSEIRSLHRILEINQGFFPSNGELKPVKYHVLDSHYEGVFSLGGDLSFFLNCLNNNDKKSMINYARACINAIYPIMVNFNLPIVTISLVRGNALGGGFEIALSGDVIIAERQAQMGFPEILFNTFPGMGAFQSLSARIGLQKATRLIQSGQLYSAEELYELGVVDILTDEGGAEEALYQYVQLRDKHWNGYMAMQQVTHKLKNYSYQQIMDICSGSWVDSIFAMTEKDIRTLNRLLRSQKRYELYALTMNEQQIKVS